MLKSSPSSLPFRLRKRGESEADYAKAKARHEAMGISSSNSLSKAKQKPTFSIVFPTADEIRSSLDGYDSGASIHTKIQTAAQQKQLQYLNPLLCHWRHDISQIIPHDHIMTTQFQSFQRKQALRGAAAPHIKTYIRFSDSTQSSIDWAMLTSANLSKQAWGELENSAKEEIWIQSWECGVVVWPGLFGKNDENVVMVPVFGKDTPEAGDLSGHKEGMEAGNKVIGFRMPYDLPLSSYKANEVPWCASMPHLEPDWKGQVWKGW